MILEHYDDEDIQRIHIQRDVNNWKAQLSSISRDVSFYDRLLASVKDKRMELAPLQTAVKEMAGANGRYHDRIIDYSNQTENIIECQDMQCEKFYLNSHEEVSEGIERHLEQFRKLKQDIHEFFNGKLEIHLT